MESIKRIIKIFSIILVTIFGIFITVILTLFIYLNCYNPEIFSTSIKKGTLITFIQRGKRVTIPVKEYMPIPLPKVPLLLRRGCYIDVYSSIPRPRRLKIISGIFIDIKELFFGEYANYDPSFYVQVAHNSLIIYNRSYPLRAEEYALAANIYERYNKSKIWESYFNHLYFGYGIFGYEAAAHYFFGKGLAELKPHHLALLAVLPIDRYSTGMNYGGYYPLKTKVLIKYRNRLLDKMTKKNLLSEEEGEKYKKKPLDLIVNIQK